MPPGVGYPAGTKPSTAGSIFASSRLNPARRSAEAIGRQRQRTSRDRYGFGAISDIPLAFAQGREEGRADDIDAQNAAAIDEQINKIAKTAEEKEHLKNKITILSKAMNIRQNQDEGTAVMFLNQFKSDIDLPENVFMSGITPKPAEGGMQVVLNYDGKDHLHWFDKNGNAFKYGDKGGEPVLMTESEMSKISTSTIKGKGKDKVGSTKERILKKISEGGFDSLSSGEQEAWSLQSNEDKTIAQEVLKNLRASDAYNALSDANDPDGSKKEAMIAGATEMVRKLFNPEGQTAGEHFLDVGGAEGQGDFQDLSGGAVDADLSRPEDTGTLQDVTQPVGLDNIPELEEDTTGGIPGLSAEESQELPKRQAPDGKFYVEDPNSPGQFYEVEG